MYTLFIGEWRNSYMFIYVKGKDNVVGWDLCGLTYYCMYSR